MPGFVKVAGSWRQLTNVYVKVQGTWRNTITDYVLRDGASREWFPDTDGGGGDPPSVELSPTSLFLDTAGTAFAEFDTTPYRGSISEISSVLSWRTTSLVNTTLRMAGRPSNTFYRNIDNNNHEWDGRTITHRIDTFNASSLTEFNNGSSIGFNIQLTSDPNFVSTVISNVKLKLVL